MTGQGEVLRDPANQRFFVWTAGGLRLTGNPPKEVVEAWMALSRMPKQKPWLCFAHGVRMQ